MKRMIVFAFLCTGSLASAQIVVKLECYTGGADSLETFNGHLIAPSIIDHSDGSFTITGRKIQQHKALDAATTDTCRNWYIHGTSSVSSGGHYSYYYSKRGRSWNTVIFTQQAATTRISCGLGSSITQFDDLESYQSESLSKLVESRPPREGSRSSTDGYISGKTTVSHPECVDYQL